MAAAAPGRAKVTGVRKGLSRPPPCTPISCTPTLPPALSASSCVVTFAADGGLSPVWNETLFLQLGNEQNIGFRVSAAGAGGSGRGAVRMASL